MRKKRLKYLRQGEERRRGIKTDR